MDELQVSEIFSILLDISISSTETRGTRKKLKERPLSDCDRAKISWAKGL